MNDELTSYIVVVDNEYIIVTAINIADACDKLEKNGIFGYTFEYSRSFKTIS